MIELLFVFVFLAVFALGVFLILNAVGVPCYPRPKFTCAECGQSELQYMLYKCKACTDEVTNEMLSCELSRGTKECYKNARKASN